MGWKTMLTTFSANVCQCGKRNGYLLLLLLCITSGYGVGILLQPSNLSSNTLYLIGFPGQLVLRAFLMIIVPIIFCSLVLGMYSLCKVGDAKMVATTLGLFATLSMSSAVMGAAAGHLVHPGQVIHGVNDTQFQSEMSGSKSTILDSVLDLLLNCIPINIIQTTFSKEFTYATVKNSSGRVIYTRFTQRKDGVNFMGLLVFSLIFGSALASLGDKGDVLHKVIEQMSAVMMCIMNYFLMLLPLGMFSWMVWEGLNADSPAQLLQQLGRFMGTALGCMILHQLLLLPTLYVCIVRRNPYTFHFNLLPAIFTAFGTSSSAVTLPVTTRCVEVVNRIHRSVSQFVLPLGMAVHMNGSTLYYALTAFFLAQMEGVELDIANTIIVCLTCFLLMIASPGTANSGNPVYFLTVMAAAGIPKPQHLSLILSIDWLMERCRTAMNVVGDCYVAAFVEALCRNRLPIQNHDPQPKSARKDNPLPHETGVEEQFELLNGV